MPDGFAAAAALLPPVLRRAAEALPEAAKARAEEFRLRMGRAPGLLLPEGERPLLETAVTAAEISAVLEAASRASYHAVTDELRRGYLAAPGGVRVGVCGTAVTDGGIKTLRELSSLSVRIPRQVRGAGAAAIAAVKDSSALIFSPPGGGKTTFLRELVRTVSDAGRRVSLCDERGELAGVCAGLPQFDVGRCTDVLSGAPKAEGALLLLRAMNPEVVAMDEISAPEDARSIETLLGCGVRIFATVHAASAAELRQRPVCRALLDAGAFRCAVRISGSGAQRRYEVSAL